MRFSSFNIKVLINGNLVPDLSYDPLDLNFPIHVGTHILGLYSHTGFKLYRTINRIILLNSVDRLSIRASHLFHY